MIFQPSSSENAVPYVSASQFLEDINSLDPADVIKEAYTTLYNSKYPPCKYTLSQPKNTANTILMPYVNEEDALYFEKVVFMNQKKRPGITGYAIAYSLHAHIPLLMIDASVLTGYRTAAKSLLFSKLFFETFPTKKPSTVVIYGSSTQAYFHALLFAQEYPSAQIMIIARSFSSKEIFENQINHLANRQNIIVTHASSFSRNQSDIIITTTSSPKPLLFLNDCQSTPLIIAVGSSSGVQSEIDQSIIRASNLYIDSYISLDGKGESHLALKNELIQRDSIGELAQLLEGDLKDFGPQDKTLFISKGLIIEDYLFVKKIMELKGYTSP